MSNLEITEVMYDVSGTDTNREWLEIRNNGVSDVDLTEYYFLENETKHRIINISGDKLRPGELAVLVANPDKFKVDFPNYNGLLFDSSFSLSNSGETLSLIDKEINVINEFNYVPYLLANGDGNSIHLDKSTWVAGVPSPGSNVIKKSSSNSSEVSNTTEEEANFKEKLEVNGEATVATQSDKGYYEGNIKLGTQHYQGSLMSFKPEIRFYKDNDVRLVKTGYLVANFGDGTSSQHLPNQEIVYSYKYAGKYIAKFDFYSSSLRTEPDVKFLFEIEIIAKPVIMVEENNLLKIFNNTDHRVDIGFWSLYENGNLLNTFPKGTEIVNQGNLVIGIYNEKNYYELRSGNNVFQATVEQEKEENHQTLDNSLWSALEVEEVDNYDILNHERKENEVVIGNAYDERQVIGDIKNTRSHIPWGISGILLLSLIYILIRKKDDHKKIEEHPYMLVNEDSL